MRVTLYAAFFAIVLFLVYDYASLNSRLKLTKHEVHSLEQAIEVQGIVEADKRLWRASVIEFKEEVKVRVLPHKQELRRVANESIKQGDGSDALNPDVVRVLKEYTATYSK